MAGERCRTRKGHPRRCVGLGPLARAIAIAVRAANYPIGAVSGACTSQAKESKEAHKEEIRHMHDKGMENLSNAAVCFPSPAAWGGCLRADLLAAGAL